MPSPGDVVTLDMSEVTFIDSTGISMLVKSRGHLEGMGCRLVLAKPSPPVVRVLAMVGLTEQFLVDDVQFDDQRSRRMSVCVPVNPVPEAQSAC
jgi:anti-anti-sigma factor